MNWFLPKDKSPDEDEFVLVTLENCPYPVPARYRREIDPETGEILNRMDFFDDMVCLNENGFKVIAWMPMPEPYKENFRVIVAGSRTFNDYDLLESKLDIIFRNRKPTSIVCGEAKGADVLGEEYAIKHNIPVDYYPAQWDKYGKHAGYMRNIEMANNAEAVVAFWDGTSSGTKHMIETAKRNNLRLRIIKV